MVSNELIEARYGRKRRAGRDRKLAIGAGSVLLVALLSFIVWASFGKAPEITGTFTSIDATSAKPVGHQIVATISFTNPSGKPARCQVSALNQQSSSVGSVEVNIPADRASSQTVKIVTMEPASESVVVDSCWNR